MPTGLQRSKNQIKNPVIIHRQKPAPTLISKVKRNYREYVKCCNNCNFTYFIRFLEHEDESINKKLKEQAFAELIYAVKKHNKENHPGSLI